MSSPQKQIGRRRLPPLNQSNQKVSLVTNRTASSANSNTPTIDDTTPDFTSTFMQGPFRTQMKSIATNGNSSPPPLKQNKYDSNAFLEGMSLVCVTVKLLHKDIQSKNQKNTNLILVKNN